MVLGGLVKLECQHSIARLRSCVSWNTTSALDDIHAAKGLKQTHVASHRDVWPCGGTLCIQHASCYHYVLKSETAPTSSNRLCIFGRYTCCDLHEIPCTHNKHIIYFSSQHFFGKVYFLKSYFRTTDLS